MTSARTTDVGRQPPKRQPSAANISLERTIRVDEDGFPPSVRVNDGQRLPSSAQSASRASMRSACRRSAGVTNQTSCRRGRPGCARTAQRGRHSQPAGRRWSVRRSFGVSYCATDEAASGLLMGHSTSGVRGMMVFDVPGPRYIHTPMSASSPITRTVSESTALHGEPSGVSLTPRFAAARYRVGRRFVNWCRWPEFPGTK
jgi:hypothetical protein